MTITKETNDTTLNIAVAGRIDTNTSPELEASINESLEGITDIVLDFKDLEYISSAGLRVLLSAKKSLAGKGELSLKNVDDIIMEILDVTGFADIVKII